MGIRLLRSLIILLLVSSVAAAQAPQPVATDPAGELDEGIVLADIPGIGSIDLFVRFDGDTPLVPFVALCEFLRVSYSVTADGTVASGELPAGNPFSLSLVEGRAKSGDEEMSFSPTAARLIDGGLYLEPSLVARLLGVGIEFDRQNVMLRIAPDERLPVVQLTRSHGRYAALRASTTNEDHPRYDAVIGRQLFGPLGIDWSIDAGYLRGTRQTSGAIDLSGPMMYGIASARFRGTSYSGRSSTFGVMLEEGSWRFLIPGSPILRDVWLGTYGVGGGRRYALALSNAPLAPRTDAGARDLEGQTQPGWTVELYDRERLAGVTTADSLGRYRFLLPIGYGVTRRTLVQVGPHGERIVEERLIELAQQILPVASIDYRLGLSNDRVTEGIARSAEVHLHAGICDWLTLGAAATLQSDWRDETVRFDRYGSAALADLWLGAGTTAGLAYLPGTATLRARVSASLAGDVRIGVAVDSFSLRRHSFALGGTFSMPMRPLSLGVSGRFGKEDHLKSIEVSPQISGYAGGISYVADASVQWRTGDRTMPEDSRSGTRIASSLTLMGSPLSWLLLSARGRCVLLDAASSSLQLSAHTRLSESIGASLFYTMKQMQWRSGAVHARLEIDLSPARATIQGEHHGEGISARSLLQGSLLISSNGVLARNRSTHDLAAIVLRAFRDENGNGTRDPGEEDLASPAATLQWGTNRVRVEDGMFVGAPLYTSCRVVVDRGGHFDRGLFPALVAINVYTVPGAVQVLDIPYVEGFDVEGSCQLELRGGVQATSSAALHGLRLRLVTAAGTSYPGEIFYDGSILIAGVPAGTYRAELDGEQLAARGLESTRSAQEFVVDMNTSVLPPIQLRVAAKNSRN